MNVSCFFESIFFATLSSLLTIILETITQSRKATISFVNFVYLPVCADAATRLPLDGYKEYIFCDFMKICRETPKFVKTGVNIGHNIEAYVHVIFRRNELAINPLTPNDL
jgi:hypothetical protein